MSASEVPHKRWRVECPPILLLSWNRLGQWRKHNVQYGSPRAQDIHA